MRPIVRDRIICVVFLAAGLSCFFAIEHRDMGRLFLFIFGSIGIGQLVISEIRHADKK